MIPFLNSLWTLARPYWVRLSLGVLSGLLSGLAEPLLVLTVVFVFKVAFPYSQDETLTKQLGALPGFVQNWLKESPLAAPGAATPTPWFASVLVVSAIPLMMLGRGVVGYLYAYFMNWVGVRAVSDLRTRLYAHLLNQPLSFYHTNSTGELMSRVGDILTLHGLFGPMLLVVIKEPVTLLSYIGVLVTLQPRLTLMAMIMLPVCLIPIVIFSRKVRRSGAAIQTHYAELSEIMHESFTGIRVVKAYNLELTLLDQFRAGTRKFIGQFMRVVRSTEIPGPLIEFAGAVGVALIFLLLISSNTQGRSPANFLGFVLSLFGIYRPLKSITRLHSQLVQARAASGRVFELLAIVPVVVDPPQPRSLRAAGSAIHFDRVDFSYGDRLILQNFNLTIQPGRLVALVGASGSGKTTLTNLLLRFYDPQRGAIRIGATDIREVASVDLRSQIALVTQETVLFNDTIRRNIELGRPGATAAEVEAAARHALAHEFILQKPQGYDTVIGERGVTLSGGQRQRIAIARAILKDAPILILDEATSSLDSESERAVQAALEKLMVDRTTVCIAHRLSTIQRADLIVVLDQGRIVESGAHDELYRRNGYYRKLCDIQFTQADQH